MTASLNKATLAALICLALRAAWPGGIHAQIPEEDIWAVDQQRARGQLTIYNSEPGGGFIGIPLELGDFNSDGKMDFVVTAMFADTGPSNNRKNGGEVYLYQGDGRLQGELDRARLPASTGTLTLEGERGGDFLGTEVFTADVNGDGIDDLLIGAQNLDLVSGNTLLRDNCGGVYVVLGRQGLFQGNSTLDLSTDNPGIIRILGAETGERAGVWVESGDLDGDGFMDILIGADQFPAAPRGEDNRIRSGKVYIIYGRDRFPPELDLATESDGVSIILGRDSGDHLGSTLHARDLDGDGQDELIASAALGRLSASLAAGSPVAAVGLGAGDGPTNSRLNCGETYIFYSDGGGGSRLPPLVDLGLPLEPQLTDRITTIYGSDAGHLLGEEISSGDLNGDGRMDLILGGLTAPGPRGEPRAGVAAIIYGWPGLRGANIDLSPDPIIRRPQGLRTSFIFGSNPGDILADTLSAVDLDGDGLDDLCVGIPRFDAGSGLRTRTDVGAALVIYGDPLGLPETWEPLREEIPCNLRIKAIVGSQPEDLLAYSLVAGDVDGDGHPDLFVNAMRGDGGDGSSEDAGEAVAVNGKLLSRRDYRITGVEPFSGALGVPVAVTIHGGDFENSPRTRVLLNGEPVEDIRIICSSRIEVILPPSQQTGPRTLAVTGPAGSATFTNAFFYLDDRKFVRGDSDLSGALEFNDGIYILGTLFLGNRVLCPDASDFDDDGKVHITDAISLFLYLMNDGQPPAQPFPVAGADPSPDELGCGS